MGWTTVTKERRSVLRSCFSFLEEKVSGNGEEEGEGEEKGEPSGVWKNSLDGDPSCAPTLGVSGRPSVGGTPERPELSPWPRRLSSGGKSRSDTRMSERFWEEGTVFTTASMASFGGVCCEDEEREREREKERDWVRVRACGGGGEEGAQSQTQSQARFEF